MFDFFNDFWTLIQQQRELAWDFIGKHPTGNAIFLLVCFRVGTLAGCWWLGYRQSKKRGCNPSLDKQPRPMPGPPPENVFPQSSNGKGPAAMPRRD